MQTTMQQIRVVALCIIKNGGKILVFEGVDKLKKQTWCRPLGGGIEFGERGEETVKREFREEIGAEIKNIKYLETLENIFIYNGAPKHEICFIFSGELADKSLYEKEEIVGTDSKGKFKAVWKPISDFRKGKLILYPSGLLDTIKN